MLTKLGDEKKRIVGIKQVLRALEQGGVSRVFVARDAEARVVAPIRERALAAGVPLEEVASMAELGDACHIQVGAAAAALRKSAL